MNIDRELHDALRRTEAPTDLADRVLALARQRSEPSAATPVRADSTVGQTHGSNRVLRWLAAAAVLAVAAGGAERYYTHQQQATEAARVQEELRIALQITNETIARVQSKLSRPADNGGR